jgi:hypothetical protein
MHDHPPPSIATYLAALRAVASTFDAAGDARSREVARGLRLVAHLAAAAHATARTRYGAREAGDVYTVAAAATDLARTLAAVPADQRGPEHAAQLAAATLAGTLIYGLDRVSSMLPPEAIGTLAPAPKVFTPSEFMAAAVAAADADAGDADADGGAL